MEPALTPRHNSPERSWEGGKPAGASGLRKSPGPITQSCLSHSQVPLALELSETPVSFSCAPLLLSLRPAFASAPCICLHVGPLPQALAVAGKLGVFVPTWRKPHSARAHVDSAIFSYTGPPTGVIDASSLEEPMGVGEESAITQAPHIQMRARVPASTGPGVGPGPCCCLLIPEALGLWSQEPYLLPMHPQPKINKLLQNPWSMYLRSPDRATSLQPG